MGIVESAFDPDTALTDTLTTSGLTQDEIDYFIRKLVQ